MSTKTDKIINSNFLYYSDGGDVIDHHNWIEFVYKKNTDNRIAFRIINNTRIDEFSKLLFHCIGWYDDWSKPLDNEVTITVTLKLLVNSEKKTVNLQLTNQLKNSDVIRNYVDIYKLNIAESSDFPELVGLPVSELLLNSDVRLDSFNGPNVVFNVTVSDSIKSMSNHKVTLVFLNSIVFNFTSIGTLVRSNVDTVNDNMLIKAPFFATIRFDNGNEVDYVNVGPLEFRRIGENGQPIGTTVITLLPETEPNSGTRIYYDTNSLASGTAYRVSLENNQYTTLGLGTIQIGIDHPFHGIGTAPELDYPVGKQIVFEEQVFS